MQPAIKILPHYTYDDYRIWEGRWELIEGIPYAMSPAPNPRHQMLSAKIITALSNAINKSGCENCKVYDFIDVKVKEDTVVQPDALVVCKEITKAYLDFPAALVVEILSPATAMKDRNNKFLIYQSMKIPYYIIIDADKKEIEIYHLKDDHKYEQASIPDSGDFIFEFEKDCNAAVSLFSIWQ